MIAPTVVLVHGAWHGGWVWHPVVERLEAEGRQVRTIELPSSGSDGARLGDLATDVDAIQRTIGEVEGDVVLVGHSYGGIPITQVANTQVRHLVYVAAFMLDEGESLLDAIDHELPDWIELVADDAASTPHRPREVFYADLELEVAQDAAGRLGLQSIASFRDRVHHVSWRDTPSTYLMAEHDRAIPPPAQEAMSARADTVHRLATSHSPMLSRPDDVVAHVGEVLATLD